MGSFDFDVYELSLSQIKSISNPNIRLEYLTIYNEALKEIATSEIGYDIIEKFPGEPLSKLYNELEEQEYLLNENNPHISNEIFPGDFVLLRNCDTRRLYRSQLFITPISKISFYDKVFDRTIAINPHKPREDRTCNFCTIRIRANKDNAFTYRPFFQNLTHKNNNGYLSKTLTVCENCYGFLPQNIRDFESFSYALENSYNQYGEDLHIFINGVEFDAYDLSTNLGSLIVTKFDKKKKTKTKEETNIQKLRKLYKKETEELAAMKLSLTKDC